MSFWHGYRAGIGMTFSLFTGILFIAAPCVRCTSGQVCYASDLEQPMLPIGLTARLQPPAPRLRYANLALPLRSISRSSQKQKLSLTRFKARF